MTRKLKPETQGALDLVALIQASTAMGLEIATLHVGREGAYVSADLYTPLVLGHSSSRFGGWSVYVSGPWAGDQEMISGYGLGIDVAARAGRMSPARVRDYETSSYPGNTTLEREAARAKLAEILALKAGGK